MYFFSCLTFDVATMYCKKYYREFVCPLKPIAVITKTIVIVNEEYSK